MIYDCFQFFNELDTLEIRLEELYPVVDKFIICESTKTHSGKNKPLRYIENIDRYRKYADKIKYIVYDNFPEKATSWDLENNQRRYLVNGLTEVSNYDMIMISDIDEIPRRSFIESFKASYIKSFEMTTTPITLCTQLFYDKLNYMVVEPEEFHNWRGTVVINGKMLKENSDLHWYRHFKDTFPNIKNTGWHFSYLGDEKQIIEKIESFAHTESDTEEIKATIRKNIGKCVDLFDRGEYKLIKIEVDSTFPEAVKNNIERYAHIL